MENGQIQPIDASSWDHYELTFWLWATLENANRYLSLSRQSRGAIEFTHIDDRPNPEELRKQVTLAAYQFVTAVGVLLRVLKRSQHLFPAIQPPYSRATHLLKEGKDMRDMMEHAFGAGGYLAGGGKNRDKFVRSEDGISADATSTIVIDGVHWLGNRLCVERVVEEVTAIKTVADTIIAPVAHRTRQLD